MPDVSVIIEHDGRQVDDTAFELLSAARDLAGEGGRVAAMLAGHGVSALTSRLADSFDVIHVWDEERLEVPDGVQLLEVYLPVIERESPEIVLVAHTNNGMDLVPALAVRSERPLVTDCLEVSFDDGVLVAVRPAYGGIVHVKVRAAESARGYLVTIRPGAVSPTAAHDRTAQTVRESLEKPRALRRRFVRTVLPDGADVDISSAERIVAVGRGIEDEEGLEMVRSLAEALGAEIACSRPVVDKQWLPKGRQVGTSGKSVKPKIYVAIGISGSFQHMGGIKGDPFLVAINKDPRAPIFAEADVGIVGDLFDIVPVLDEKIRALKS